MNTTSHRRYWMRLLQDSLFLVAGSLLTALSLVWFLVPSRIAAGGITGLATIVYHWLGRPVGMVALAINLPLLILAVLALGWPTTSKTVLGSVLLSVFVDGLSPHLPALTGDSLLAAICGGILAGIGLGLCFKAGGSTGGTDVIALLLQRRSRGKSLGGLLISIDGLVLVLAALAFSPELSLYALVALIGQSLVVNMVLEGVPYARQAVVIAHLDKSDEICQAIMANLERGVTTVTGQGRYTQTGKQLIMVAIARSELRQLTDTVFAVDPRAFIMVSDLRAVLGEGFDESHLSLLRKQKRQRNHFSDQGDLEESLR